ncbi:MAG TPA: hypothetical protein VHV57_03330 [Acidimicrobiales bacterium]|nr:hypothetical protein [Acidimicrobiales bacterium]
MAFLAAGLGVGGSIIALGASPAGAAPTSPPLPAPVVTSLQSVLNPILNAISQVPVAGCATYIVVDGVLADAGLEPPSFGRPGCIAE